MPWNSPRTWVAGEIPTATIFNEHVRDNISRLFAPYYARYLVNEGADYSTSSTSFVDIDATDLALTIADWAANRRALIGFHGNVYATVNFNTYFDVAVDGVRLAGDDGLIAVQTNTAPNLNPVSFVVPTAALAAGSHTFKLQWKVGSSTAVMPAGAGTSTRDLHPCFWVMEF